jgi:hypothetical protein
MRGEGVPQRVRRDASPHARPPRGLASAPRTPGTSTAETSRCAPGRATPPAETSASSPARAAAPRDSASRTGPCRPCPDARG